MLRFISIPLELAAVPFTLAITPYAKRPAGSDSSIASSAQQSGIILIRVNVPPSIFCREAGNGTACLWLHFPESSQISSLAQRNPDAFVKRHKLLNLAYSNP
jgi:hypothetical protein